MKFINYFWLFWRFNSIFIVFFSISSSAILATLNMHHKDKNKNDVDTTMKNVIIKSSLLLILHTRRIFYVKSTILFFLPFCASISSSSFIISSIFFTTSFIPLPEFASTFSAGIFCFLKYSIHLLVSFSSARSYLFKSIIFFFLEKAI